MNGSSKLRLIQCGVGGHGRAWWMRVTSQSPDFELVAIVDVSDAALHEAGDALNIPRERRFASLESALESVAADAVLTVAPPAAHVEHARLAFAHGLHLLTEKPIAHDLASAREMVELARRADRQLVVGQSSRYSAAIERFVRLARDEQPVGPFAHGHIDFLIPADFPGTFRETMEFPLLVDMAIHHVDLIRAVTGRNVVRVSANSFRPSWSWFRHDPGLKMTLELEDKILFTYNGDWTARGQFTSWNGDWRLQCERGAIHLQKNQITISRCEKWMKNLQIESIDAPPIPREAQEALLYDFAEAIRTNRPAQTSGADNLHSFAAVMCAVESAKHDGAWLSVEA